MDSRDPSPSLCSVNMFYIVECSDWFWNLESEWVSCSQFFVNMRSYKKSFLAFVKSSVHCNEERSIFLLSKHKQFAMT